MRFTRKLKKGIDFSILEYNGAGAGIQHVSKHWKILYQISVYNHKANGIDYYEKKKGKGFLKLARRNIQLLKKLDAEFPVF